MTTPVIETPRGLIYVDSNNKAELKWKPNFRTKWQGRYTKAQKFVDSEVLRLSEPFTPLLTGTLIKSGILGTNIGSGEVSWIAPYARFQYYRPAKIGTYSGLNRGPFWFKRMKAISGSKILAGGKKIAGGGG